MVMDVKLKPFDFAAAVARAGLRTDGTPIAGGVGSPSATSGAAGAGKAGFGAALTDALKGVSDSQNQAQWMQNDPSLAMRHAYHAVSAGSPAGVAL